MSSPSPILCLAENPAGATEDVREVAYKILLIGDPLVGKTSFVQRLVNGTFRTHYKLTMGVDYALKVIQRPDNRQVKLQFWDVAGQERFTSLTRVYYKGAHGCIVMFDLSQRDSFASAARWKRDLDNKCSLPDGTLVPSVLVGNKCDLHDRAVPETEIESMSQELEFIGSAETSVKENLMVHDTIMFLLEAMEVKATELETRVTSSMDISQRRHLVSQEHKKTSCRC